MHSIDTEKNTTPRSIRCAESIPCQILTFITSDLKQKTNKLKS